MLKMLSKFLFIILVTTMCSSCNNFVQFNYLNNLNPNGLDILDTNSIAALKLLTNRPFKVLLHGWTEFGDENYYSLLSLSYFLKGQYNIIQVDWHKSSTKDYISAAKDSVQIGKCLANIIVALNRERGVSMDDFHLIGHSVGAQIAGYTGKYVQNITDKKVGRISGLDPAAMLFTVPFSINRREEMLKHGDAAMVDIIHTDSGVIGYDTNIGTADFYANTGKATQPPCSKINLVIYGVWKFISCSHQLSSLYFAESILSDKFVATQCYNYVEYQNGRCNGNKKLIFGEDMPLDARGSFFFQTSHTRPYSKLLP